jgi:hypothetical protein
MTHHRPLFPARLVAALMWLTALLSMPVQAELPVAQGSASAAATSASASFGDPSDWTYTRGVAQAAP